MQRDRGGAFGFGDAAGIQMGVVDVVDADAELDGDRYLGAFRGAYGCGDDLAEQPPFERQRRAAPRLVTFGTGQPKFMSM